MGWIGDFMGVFGEEDLETFQIKVIMKKEEYHSILQHHNISSVLYVIAQNDHS